MYATYEYYTDTFLGRAIAASDFARLELRAREEVDYVTRGQAAAYYAHNPSPISSVTCAVAELLHQAEAANSLSSAVDGGGIVHSERVNSHQVTYADRVDPASLDGQSAIEAALQRVIAKYLMRTGLLYRGVAMI